VKKIGRKQKGKKVRLCFINVVVLFFSLLSLCLIGFAQEGEKEIQDPFTYLIEHGSRMIRENEIDKLFHLIDRLPQEKKYDFRIRVIENFTNLKAYLVIKKKEYGKRWQSDYKPMVYSRNKSATPILIDLLKDSDPYIRAFTARALGYLGDERALEVLKQLAETDPNSKVKSRAKWAYEYLSGKKFSKEPIED